MAMTDILIPEGDPQQGILELGVGSSHPAYDMLSDTGIEELILTGGGATTGYGGG